jgi:mRNA interferase RelE/StbE
MVIGTSEFKEKHRFYRRHGAIRRPGSSGSGGSFGLVGYEIVFNERAQEYLSSLSREVAEVIRPAARAISDVLPENVAAAVLDFVTGARIENPHRVGRELRRELAGIYSARRGTYRILYQIDDVTRTVTVLRIDHRSDIYRTR